MSSASDEILQLRLSRGREMVEGNWSQFQFKMILPSDYPEVLDCLHQHFYNGTPLTKGWDCSPEYYREFDQIYLECLPQNLSFYARDITTDEIVALRIIFIQDWALEEQFLSFGFKTSQMAKMNKIMGTVNKMANIYGQFGITHFVNFFTACVDPRYRCQGIATQMYQRALHFVSSFSNFKYVKSNFGSPYTRRIGQKLGFVELARVYFKDFEDSEGQPLLAAANDDEFVAFMVKKL